MNWARRSAITLLLALQWGSVGSAAGGWSLMTPPLVEKPVTEADVLKRFPAYEKASKDDLRDMKAILSIRYDAPIAIWSHESSFDTAAECEQTRQRLMASRKADEERFRREYPDGLPTLLTILMREARCIASDDVRLKP